MPSHTTFLIRLIGLYLVLISLAMLTHKQSAIESITALMRNPPLLFVTAVFAMAAGLAMVLGHNVWSGGVLPVVVTLTGWAMLIKASLLLFLSPASATTFFLAGLHYEQHFYQYMSFSLLFGACLTYAGFKSTPH
jgi:hypothetical protein